MKVIGIPVPCFSSNRPPIVRFILNIQQYAVIHWNGSLGAIQYNWVLSIPVAWNFSIYTAMEIYPIDLHKAYNLGWTENYTSLQEVMVSVTLATVNPSNN